MADEDRDHAVERSWRANAEAWTRAVREGRIESRRTGTDAAVVAEVLRCRPRRVLDVGCGEGWLARRLAEEGIAVVGFDASPELVERAAQAGGGSFHVLTYREFVASPTRPGAGFDVVVCNFSLLSADPGPVLRACARVLSPRGALVIQTVHPWTAAGGEGYVDGWRTETFSSLGEGFREPMPWYFRTVGSWLDELRDAGLELVRLREPLHSEGRTPLSLILTARPRAS